MKNLKKSDLKPFTEEEYKGFLERVGHIDEQCKYITENGIIKRSIDSLNENKLTSAYYSLLLNGNSTPFSMVRDLYDGHIVKSNNSKIPNEDIILADNMVDVYRGMLLIKPYSIGDFLATHRNLTKGAYPEVGIFRREHLISTIYDGHVYLAPPFKDVDSMMSDLLDWARDTEINPLIKALCVYFNILKISPVSVYNESIARVWLGIFLYEYDELLGWISVEDMIYKCKDNYDRVLYEALTNDDPAIFMEYMLYRLSILLGSYCPKGFLDNISNKLNENSKNKDNIVDLEYNILNKTDEGSLDENRVECENSAKFELEVTSVKGKVNDGEDVNEDINKDESKNVDQDVNANANIDVDGKSDDTNVNGNADMDVDDISPQVKKLLDVMGDEPLSTKELMELVKLKHRPTFRANYLLPAIDMGLVEMTIPDKPNSSKQKYLKIKP